MESSELLHTFTPCREIHDEELPPKEPPITRMFTSSDGQWLAAVNCFGDIYVFNLEILRWVPAFCQTSILVYITSILFFFYIWDFCGRKGLDWLSEIHIM